MNTITQTMMFRQAVIKYSLTHGVTKAAIRYKVNRQYVYRWRKRFDGTLQSLADKSHRPHHHPNEHTAEELKLTTISSAVPIAQTGNQPSRYLSRYQTENIGF